MKLPPVQLASRKQGPGADYQSIAIEHQAKQGLAAAAVGVAESYIDAEASSQALSAKQKAKQGLGDLHRRLEGSLTNVKDLGEVAYRKEDETTGPDGEQYVPTHTVAKGIWEKGISDIKADASTGIRHQAAKGEFGAFWDQAIDASGSEATKQIDKATRGYHVNQKTQAVNQAIATGDYEAAVENLFFLKKEGFIDASTHSKMLDDTKDAIEETEKASQLEGYETLLLEDATTAADVEGLYAAEAQLRKDKPFGAKESDRLADAMEKKADENKLSLYAQEEQRKGQLVSNVELAIDAKDPRVTEGTIQALYDDEVISSEKMTSMKKSYRAIQKKFNDDLAIDAKIQADLSNGVAIDPTNKAQRDAVNRYYESDVKAGADPWTSAINTASTYHIVPERVIGLMRGSNRADAPQLLNAAVMYNQAKRHAPTSLEDLNRGTDLVRGVAANLALNMAGPDAVQTAIEWENMDESRRDAMKVAYKATVSSNVGALKDLISGSSELDTPWYKFAQDVPLTMQTQFDLLTEQYISTAGGNVQAAQQKAFGDIQAEWSSTDINGADELMRNAPVGNVKSMRKSIDRDYGEGAMIRSDPLTEIQKREGVPQTYHITRSGDVPEIETKARKNSNEYTKEWRESFEKSAGMSVDQLGITNKDEAQEFLNALYEGDNVVDLGRWAWDAEAEAEKENKTAIKEAKASYEKRRSRQEQKEINKAEWTIRNEAVEKGLNPAEYLESEEGVRRKEFVLQSLKKSGDLF